MKYGLSGYFPYLDYIISHGNAVFKAVFGYKYFFRGTEVMGRFCKKTPYEPFLYILIKTTAAIKQLTNHTQYDRILSRADTIRC